MNSAFSKKGILRSVLIVTGSTYVTYACGLLVSTLIARSLGPADYGRYSYVVWLSGVLIMFFTNGLGASGMRFVSEAVGYGDASAARNVHGWLQKYYYVGLVLVSIVFCAVVRFLEPAGWEGRLWVFAAITLVSALAKAHYLFPSSMAKGYGNFGVEAATTNIMSAVSLMGAGILALQAAPLDAFLTLFMSVCVGHAVVTHIYMRRADIRPSNGSVEPGLTSRIRRHLLWTIVLTLVAAFSNKSLETFLLNKWVGPEAVGFFLLAATLTRGGIDLLTSGLTTVLMPVMSHAFGVGGTERVNRVLADSVRYFAFIGLLLAGIGALWAGPTVSIMYGDRFESATFGLRAMLLVGGLTLADCPFGALLTTTDNQSIRVGVAILYVVTTAVTAFALVPAYGLVGAVLAHVLSRTIMSIAIAVSAIVALKIRPPPATDILRLFAAAGCGALAAGISLLMSSGVAGQVLAGVLYGATYLGATLVLRVWHPQDVSLLGMLAHRIPLLGKAPQWLERWVRSAAPAKAD